ncbi:uncharacterized protein LOC108863723 [Galendromus occidentalis]|uniref:Uncharacterized protein LOC108863723 n=1 Tax=Galendromus occidentalis TaxID=34638 RepID=A0AAJ7P914_9ACAR|nr:uncharacterized protein LOC108863723 [Galendromus occidentalis]
MSQDIDEPPDGGPRPPTKEECENFNRSHKQRTTLRSFLTKACKSADEFVRQYVPSDPARREALVHIAKIEGLHSQIEEMDRILMPLAATLQPERLTASLEKQINYRHAAEVALLDLRELVRAADEVKAAKAQSQSIPSTSRCADRNQDQGHQQIAFIQQAPTPADIPKFFGDVKRFRDWWQHFEYLVDSKPLPLTEKFRLLKLSLRGQAAAAVSELGWEESSYGIAKTTLKDRFGKQSDANAQHILSIIGICKQRDGFRNDKLNHFVSQISQNLKALIGGGATRTPVYRSLCSP